jgi:hypothetical protein
VEVMKVQHQEHSHSRKVELGIPLLLAQDPMQLFVKVHKSLLDLFHQIDHLLSEAKNNQ